MAPCRLCEAGCKCFGKACDSVCGCIGNVFRPILDNPLGHYVLLTWMAMLVAMVLAVVGVSQATCKFVKQLTLADVLIALIHAGTAYYIQRRLVVQLAGSQSAADITKQAAHILLYDVGFCLYSVFAVFAFGFNIYLLSSLGCESDTDKAEASNDYAAITAGWMLFYSVCAFNYAICWYCGKCCCSIASGGAKESKGAPAQQPVQAVIFGQVPPDQKTNEMV